MVGTNLHIPGVRVFVGRPGVVGRRCGIARSAACGGASGFASSCGDASKRITFSLLCPVTVCSAS